MKLAVGTIEWIRDNIDDIDFIIYTGDSSSHNSPALTGKISLSEINFVLDTFEKQMPDTPLYHTLGNHDIFMQDQYGAKYPFNFQTKMYMENFWNKWKKHVGHVKNNENTIKLGG